MIGNSYIKRLIKVFNNVDRELYIPKGVDSNIDTWLPLGFGQTISQPSLVLDMTRRLEVTENDKVLEIGTGSGYQTAILALLSDQVYTVEIVPELSLKAQERLYEQGISNVRFKVNDGSDGWIEHAPYSRILVTCGCSDLPINLIEQLDNNGIMIVPIGNGYNQVLTEIRKNTKADLEVIKLYEVEFVEFKGKYGWKE